MSAGVSSQADDVMAESYVGSYVRLITKVGIRYEGIMLKLDVQESTILLQDVKQYGTEGRRKDGPQVPPVNMVYESILFRGSEIQDLNVLSLPPLQSSSAVPDDPAIITTNYPLPSFTTTTQGYGGSNLVQQPRHQLSFDAHLTGSPSNLRSSHVPLTILSGLAHFPVTYVPMVSTEVASNSVRPNILAIAAANTSSLPRPPGLSCSPDAMAEYDAKTILAPESYSHMSDSLNTEQVYRGSTSQAYQDHEDHGERRSPEYIGQGRGQGDKGRGRGQGDKGRGRGQGDMGQGDMERGFGRSYMFQKKKMDAPGVPVYQNYAINTEGSRNEAFLTDIKFTEDFDFEAMNQKFNKAEVWDHLGKNNPSEAVDAKEDGSKRDESHATDQLQDEWKKHSKVHTSQKKDFFDSISHGTPEVKFDREKIKLASEQRKLNAETFGVPKPQRDHGNLRSNVAGSSQGPNRGRGSRNPGRGRGKTDQDWLPKKPPS